MLASISLSWFVLGAEAIGFAPTMYRTWHLAIMSM